MPEARASRQKLLIGFAGGARTMLHKAALASSVVASIPIVLPFTRIDVASTCGIHVKTARWVFEIDRVDHEFIDERRGCQLRAIHRAAYPQLPEEIQLLWYKDLPR